MRLVSFGFVIVVLAALGLGWQECLADTAPVFLQNIGSPGTGPTQYVDAAGVATDMDGNVYVADAGGDKILKYTGTGAFLGSWGTTGSGPGQFNRPFDVAVESNGTIFVSDAHNMRIQVFDSGFAYVRAWGLVDAPRYLFLGEGGLIYSNPRPYVVVYDTVGTFVREWTYAAGATSLMYGFGMDRDTLYLTDANAVYKLSSTGQNLLAWGGAGSGNGEFQL